VVVMVVVLLDASPCFWLSAAFTRSVRPEGVWERCGIVPCTSPGRAVVDGWNLDGWMGGTRKPTDGRLVEMEERRDSGTRAGVSKTSRRACGVENSMLAVG